MTIDLRFTALPAPLRFGKPRQILRADTYEQVRPVLRAAEAAAQAGAWVVGFVAYEAAPAFDPALAVSPEYLPPLAWFGVYEPGDQLPPPPPPAPVPPLDWQPQISRGRYDAAIADIRAAIVAGDTYQINYTLQIAAHAPVDAAALFEQLHQAQPAPFAAFLDIGSSQILSLSPELFFHRAGGTITTRPMKGTVPRGRWPAEDAERRDWLADSPKDQAENLMIVDLLRNDIGRVADVGTVHVPTLFHIERYPTVWQMTSTVTATERPGTTLEDAFAALFPCGSVTGAPKIRSMQIIQQLEQRPRGVYCGAIGVLLPGGEAIFNVAIRTAVREAATGRAIYSVGGGITFDSSAGAEYDEALAKAALLRERWPAFQLLETLRLRRGRYTLREGHLARMAASAAYFGFPFEAGAARALLDAHAGAGDARIRLMLDAQGRFTAERGPLGAPAPGPLRVTLAASPVESSDRFLFHKTTNRAVYEAARAERSYVFDVLLWNERGELTEFTIGNLVAELDGRLYTPPLESGVLAGVLRSVLLRRGTLAERVLLPADLARASRVWLINSVRGWVPVRVV